MESLRLGRPWAGRPAGKVLGAVAGDGVQEVVDAQRLEALRAAGFDRAPEPEAVPQRTKRRRDA